ncbi:MAG: hypothetical protein HFH82_17460 [Lachnospiraceae bacterium]|nr:hypothetical protein [Lachnospiraceae bacterium]
MTKGEENVISVINDGLRSGTTAIPGADGGKFPAVRSVTQYLDAFGVMIAERIKNQFRPLFDPAVETLSPEILAVNENIKKNAGRERQRSGWPRSIPTSRGKLSEDGRRNISTLPCALPI